MLLKAFFTQFVYSPPPGPTQGGREASPVRSSVVLHSCIIYVIFMLPRGCAVGTRDRARLRSKALIVRGGSCEMKSRFASPPDSCQARAER